MGDLMSYSYGLPRGKESKGRGFLREAQGMMGKSRDRPPLDTPFKNPIERL